MRPRLYQLLIVLAIAATANTVQCQRSDRVDVPAVSPQNEEHAALQDMNRSVDRLFELEDEPERRARAAAIVQECLSHLQERDRSLRGVDAIPVVEARMLLLINALGNRFVDDSAFVATLLTEYERYVDLAGETNEAYHFLRDVEAIVGLTRSNEAALTFLKEEQEKRTGLLRDASALRRGKRLFERGGSLHSARLVLEPARNSSDAFVSKQAEGITYEIEFLSVGRSLPEFSARLISGRTFTSAEFRGRPALIVVTATDCGGCATVPESLRGVTREFATLEVLLIYSCIEEQECSRELRAVGAEKWGYLVGVAKRGEDWTEGCAEVIETLRIARLPTAFFVDAKGGIRASSVQNGGIAGVLAAIRREL